MKQPRTLFGRGHYRSDFDLLIVVNNRKLTDFATYWNIKGSTLR